MTPDKSRLGAMRAALMSAANSDGGWGYYSGHSSRIEPTCWALLGLLASAPGRDPSISDFLVRSQRDDGLLLEPTLARETGPNLGFNAIAALLVNAYPNLANETFQRRILAGIASHKGVPLSALAAVKQDNSIEGWAWIDGSFSWVEPTCSCALALSKSAVQSAQARQRIDDAQRLLVDRCCVAGGWNYGNSNMFGKALHPYVPTTALGLLAMQGRPNDGSVVRSLEWLSEHYSNETSAMALALTLIAFRVYRRSTDDVEERLLSQWDRTGFLGNAHLIGLALYSLSSGADSSGAFRV
jgi:hypothetical protein